MAGSPKKRARREAAERERSTTGGALKPPETQQHVGTELPEPGESASAPEAEGSKVDLTAVAAPNSGSVVPVVEGELLTPPTIAEPTRTALKRAMRARAQEHAEKAIAVLVRNLNSKDEKLANTAANDLLAWGFGKPATEIEPGDGAQMIVIRRFGDRNE